RPHHDGDLLEPDRLARVHHPVAVLVIEHEGADRVGGLRGRAGTDGGLASPARDEEKAQDDESAEHAMPTRSPPPTWGGIGWGVDERAEPNAHRPFLPPAWGRIGGGVDER